MPTANKGTVRRTPAERNALFLANEPLARTVTLRFWAQSRLARQRGTFEDWLAEAHLALLHAAEQFDPSLGWTFGTYAWTCCWRRLHVHSKRQGIIRIPEGAWGNATGREPNESAMRLVAPALRRFVECPREPDRDDDPQRVRAALARLPAKYQMVLRRRFGFAGPAEKYADIGRALGCGRMRAHQVYRAALKSFARVYGRMLCEAVQTA